MKTLFSKTLTTVSILLVLPSLTYAQEPTPSTIITPSYDKELQQLKSIITSYEDYIELRTKGFDTINQTPGLLSTTSQTQLSDISTRLNSIKTYLETADETNYTDIMKKVHTDLKKLSTDLKDINSKHRSEIEKNYTMYFVLRHEESIISLQDLVNQNEKEIQFSNDLKEKLESIIEDIDELKEEDTIDIEKYQGLLEKTEELGEKIEEELKKLQTK